MEARTQTLVTTIGFGAVCLAMTITVGWGAWRSQPPVSLPTAVGWVVFVIAGLVVPPVVSVVTIRAVSGRVPELERRLVIRAFVNLVIGAWVTVVTGFSLLQVCG